MSLDVYVGPLSRYYSLFWLTPLQQSVRDHGKQVVSIIADRRITVAGPEDIADEPGGPVLKTDVGSWSARWSRRKTLKRVLAWRQNLSDALRDAGGEPLDWEDTLETRYFTHPLGWDAYQHLLLWAAYLQVPEFERPSEPVDDCEQDPAYLEAMQNGFKYGELLSWLWLPGNHNEEVEVTTLRDEDLFAGWNALLLAELADLNSVSWKASTSDIEEWRNLKSQDYVPFEDLAKYGFAVLHNMAELSVRHHLPMTLDG